MNTATPSFYPVQSDHPEPPLLEDHSVVDSPDESTTMAVREEIKVWVSEEIRKAESFMKAETHFYPISPSNTRISSKRCLQILAGMRRT
jgi:hypothetical protein